MTLELRIKILGLLWSFHALISFSAGQFATPHPETADELVFSSEWSENDEPAQTLSRPEIAPLRNYGSIRALEFFWAGSGGGPVTTEADGGLAWEDSGPGVEDGPIILVTKTKVLYKTVLSTLYPVEMTPTLVMSGPHATPQLPSTPSSSPSSVSTLLRTSDLVPSPTISVPEGTLLISEILPTEKPTKPSENHISDVLLNQLYWVQTIIRANASVISLTEPTFTHEMQSNLARVYAAAFKRHLLSALGILNQQSSANLEELPSSSDPVPSTTLAPPPDYNGSDGLFEGLEYNDGLGSSMGPPRRRRSSRKEDWIQIDEQQFAEASANFFYLANIDSRRLTPSQMRSLATAVLNVTVSIINITQVDNSVPHVTLSYIVCAEGNPVLASSAVHDLNLVKKKEMEQEIGYEVINKAEALVASPLQEQKIVEIATSPWLIVAIVSIVIMAILVIIIMVMVWKWKSNRLGDTGLHASSRSDPGDAVSEDVGRCRLGTWLNNSRRSGSSVAPPRNSDDKSAPSPPVEHTKVHKPRDTSSSITESRASHQQSKHQQRALASELDNLISRRERPPSATLSASSGSELSIGRQSQNSDRDTVPGGKDQPRRSSARYRTNSSNVRRTSPRRKTRRQEADSDLGQGRHRRRRSETENVDEYLSGFPDVPKVADLDSHLNEGKAVDKISYDDLEVCQEPIARPLSSKARKLLPQRGHGSRARDLENDQQRQALKDVQEMEEEVGPGHGDQDNDSTINDKDREISESMEHIASVCEPLKKDAAAQTPTRKKGRRSRRDQQISSESLISTESEEIFEVHHFDDSEDQNPIGKMRKRFHQFLDDAFNVMGKKDDPEEGRAQSAKIWVSRTSETREVVSPRPVTSQSGDDELTSGSGFRTKSASFGPPRTGWSDTTSATGSQETLHPGRSASGSFRGKVGPSRQSRPGTSTSRNEEISDYISGSVRPRIPQPAVRSSLEPVFPNYPIYPDVPLPPEASGTAASPSSPAVPLIMAIKEEIKRFEKIKTTKTKSSLSEFPPS